MQSRRGPHPRPVRARLIELSEPEPNSGCWLWRGQIVQGGYGRLDIGPQRHYVRARKVLAHRAMWLATVGPIPEGFDVLHHCDVPPCVNPAHLWLGTRSDNMRDAAAKGRQAFQRHPDLARAAQRGSVRVRWGRGLGEASA